MTILYRKLYVLTINKKFNLRKNFTNFTICELKSLKNYKKECIYAFTSTNTLHFMTLNMVLKYPALHQHNSSQSDPDSPHDHLEAISKASPIHHENT